MSWAARQLCYGRDSACKWTSLSSTYNNNNNNSNEIRSDLLTLCNTCVDELDDAKSYLPKNTYQSWLNTVNNIINTMPAYKISATRNSYRYCRYWRRFLFWKTRCGSYGNQYYWDVNVNNSYVNDLNNLKTQVQNIRDAIPVTVYNNCSNPYTLLDQTGMNSCGLQTLLDTQKKSSETTQMTQSNKFVMDNIKNTSEYPQFSLASKRNVNVNTMYDWEPLNSRSTYNSDYASSRKIDIENILNTYNNEIPQQYNKCSNPNTSISLDEKGTPYCVSSDYNASINRCSQAYEMSQVYEYGTDQLMQLWTDVSNSIPGNTLSTNKTVLNNADDSCKKWIDMFNVWQEKEDEAIAKPCVPERPITSTNDKVIAAMIDNWYEKSNKHIDGLNKKLDDLKNKLKNIPNVLEINKENISEAPPGMVGTVSVRNKQVPFGEMPTQYLEMILPSGTQGETGITGIKGITGINGENGDIGPTGQTGVPVIPNHFNPNI